MDNKDKQLPHIDDIENANRRRHKLALLAAGAIATVLAGDKLIDAMQPPEMEGKQIVRVEPGMTVDGIIKSEVDGGANNVRTVKEYVVNENPGIFEDGMANLGSEDLGKDLILPESVQD